MARASGEVGNLSEADKKPFGGSRALDAKIKQYFSELYKGKKTPENLKFISDLATTFQRTGQIKKVKLAKERAKQYSKALQGKMSENEIFEMLSPIGEPSSGNRIKVMSPDGKAGTIPKEQLQDALKQGYKQVQ